MIQIKLTNLLKLTFSVVLCMTIAACGSSSSSENGDDYSSTGGDSSSNPIARTQFFGQEGNIYKPVSDETASGGGNLVVLLSAQFTEQFDSCEISTADGEVAQLFCLDSVPWTQIPFSCFSNGNRQTWRASFRCTSAGEVRVVCRDTNQEVTFTVPEAQRGAVCSRFG